MFAFLLVTLIVRQTSLQHVRFSVGSRPTCADGGSYHLRSWKRQMAGPPWPLMTPGQKWGTKRTSKNGKAEAAIPTPPLGQEGRPKGRKRLSSRAIFKANKSSFWVVKKRWLLRGACLDLEVTWAWFSPLELALNLHGECGASGVAGVQKGGSALERRC